MYEVGKCLLPDLLVQARITQQELADKLGVTKQQINTYTSNKRLMSLTTAINIAIILKCDVTQLYVIKYVNDRNKRR